MLCYSKLFTRMTFTQVFTLIVGYFWQLVVVFFSENIVMRGRDVMQTLRLQQY